MVEVSIEDDKAIFTVEASHRLWAVKSRVEVPLAHITGVRADPRPAMGWFDGLKLMGTDLPNMFRAGTFFLHGHLVFYDVRHPENTVVVELSEEHYAQLIVEVADPEETVRMLQEALANWSRAARP
jgi:hypothetical protein